jgi:hypothetical protein
LLCSRKFSFVNFYFQEDEKVEKKAEALDHSVDLEGNLEDLGGVDSGANVEAERLARRVSVPDELENETEAFDPFGQETEPEVVVKRGRILEPKYVAKSEGKKKTEMGFLKVGTQVNFINLNIETLHRTKMHTGEAGGGG